MQKGTVPLNLTWWQRVLVSLVIAGGLVGIVVGVLSSTTRDGTSGLPTGIESVSPVRGAQAVPAQTSIRVDLGEGYTGILTIDGVELRTYNMSDGSDAGSLPGAQAEIPDGVTLFEPGNATLTYTPTDGAPVEKLDARLHVVTLRYWKLVDGPAAARTFAWQFNVF